MESKNKLGKRKRNSYWKDRKKQGRRGRKKNQGYDHHFIKIDSYKK